MFKEDDGEGIPTVFEDLDINDELLTIEEVEKATSIFVEGKASRPDGIPPEVLKRCNLNEIILNFANNLFNDCHKPYQ